MRLLALHQWHILRDECLISTTTATNDIHQSFVDDLTDLGSHCLCRLVIESHGIGQSGVGMTGDIIRSLSGKFSQIRLHLVGTKRTVQSDRENRIAADTGQEGIERLTAERASCQITDGHGEHDRHFPALFHHRLHRSINSSFGIQCVEDGLYQQSIHATGNQTVHLFEISLYQFIVSEISGSRIVHIRRHRTGLIRRACRASHKSRFLRS